MNQPNFARGVPPTAAPTRGPGPTTWLARYDGTCGYCQAQIQEGIDKVQWNEDATAVVCASHRVQ